MTDHPEDQGKALGHLAGEMQAYVTDEGAAELAGERALLARGIGRHLSFGYGMLLLRLPSRR